MTFKKTLKDAFDSGKLNFYMYLFCIYQTLENLLFQHYIFCFIFCFIGLINFYSWKSTVKTIKEKHEIIAYQLEKVKGQWE